MSARRAHARNGSRFSRHQAKNAYSGRFGFVGFFLFLAGDRGDALELVGRFKVDPFDALGVAPGFLKVDDECPRSQDGDFSTGHGRYRRFDLFHHNAAAVREDLINITLFGLQHALPRRKNPLPRSRKSRSGSHWELALQQVKFILVRHIQSFRHNDSGQSDSELLCSLGCNSSLLPLIYPGQPG
jgi:hypothetical protein